MTPLARVWLRRIALGLPLVGVTVLSACSTGGDCPTSTELYDVSAAQLAALADGTTDCRALCEELQRMNERPTMSFGAVSRFDCPSVDADGGILLECHFVGLCGGRAPAGLQASRGGRARGTIGAHLADAAHLELASVPAFVELAHELSLHGAPRAMTAAARRSADDEVRHAVTMRRLARAVGAVPAPVERSATTTRTMGEMVEDNAIAGCVGEAHAALVAAHQAANAPTAALRGVFAAIARDEARHALLSFAIHDWARSRMSSKQVRALDERRREAAERLLAEAAFEPDPTVVAALGIPNAERNVDLGRSIARCA